MFVTLLVVVSCAPSEPKQALIAESSPSPAPGEPIDARSRTTCATRVLTALVDAINSRDDAAIGRIIASGPAPLQAFQWVSISAKNIGPGTGETEYSPEGARRMLVQHAAAGERWALGSVRAGDGPSWHGGVDAEVHFDRQPAAGPVVRTSGKTALSCIGTAIYVLSLGDD